MSSIAIIGSGFSGIMCGRFLRQYADISIFEKEERIGGRIASLTDNRFSFDYGAQFFTVKDDNFKILINELVKKKIIKSWLARFVEISDTRIMQRRLWDDDYSHYVGVPDMYKIIHYLGTDLSIKTKSHVGLIKRDNQQWILYDNKKKILGAYDFIITAVPLEPTYKLLPDYIEYKKQLKHKVMQSCNALMLGFDTLIPLDWDVALIKDREISWVSVNTSKPKRLSNQSMTILSTNKWSDDHYNHNDHWVKQAMMQESKRILGSFIDEASYVKLHRWAYANTKRQGLPFSFVDKTLSIGSCGDWFISGRIESAFQSAFHLSQYYINELL